MRTGEILDPPSLEERIDVCRTHLLESIRWKGDKLGVLEMRRHYANYFRAYKNIKPYRLKLCTSDTLEELLDTLQEIRMADLELVEQAA